MRHAASPYFDLLENIMIMHCCSFKNDNCPKFSRYICNGTFEHSTGLLSRDPTTAFTQSSTSLSLLHQRQRISSQQLMVLQFKASRTEGLLPSIPDALPEICILEFVAGQGYLILHTIIPLTLMKCCLVFLRVYIGHCTI